MAASAIGACGLLVVLAAAAASVGRAEPSGAGGVRQLRGYGGGGGGAGRKVGGWAEVRDVEGDREVQELGRYSVEEHNRRGGGGRLEFARVVSAQRQVVSGVKYYLRVVAAEEGARSNDPAAGVDRAFDAVVVVKPWRLDEPRTLLRFAPADAK